MTITLSAGDALHAVTITETAFTALHDLIPQMDDEQIVATYQRAGELGKRAWLVQAHCLWEARRRKDAYHDDDWHEIAAGFGVSRSWGQRLCGAWDAARESVLRSTDSDLPLAKSFYVVAGETDAPAEWVAWAEDRKAENPAYSVRDLRTDIEQDSHLFTEPAERHAVHFSSDTPEWYTPPAIIKAVEDFFDRIDLDPCSNSKDAPNVPANQHLVADDDGLHAPWWGRVYMNPPYGREIGPWVSRACRSYEMREIEAAILLVPARTDTEWFRRLRDFPICFIGGRVRFISSDGEAAGAPFPSALVYLGDEFDRYARAVAHLGDVWTRYQTEAS